MIVNSIPKPFALMVYERSGMCYISSSPLLMSITRPLPPVGTFKQLFPALTGWIPEMACNNLLEHVANLLPPENRETCAIQYQYKSTWI